MPGHSLLSPTPFALSRRRLHLRRAIVACLAIGALAGAPAARAGGDFVDLAAGDGRVWFAGLAGVRSLDEVTGREVSMARLAGAPYALSVTVAGDAAWVASVENGYVWGMLSRVDERTGRVRVVWRRQGNSVQFVAAGAGSVWALVGSKAGSRIVRFTLAGRLTGAWHIGDAGRIAADSQGCWITTGRWLLHIDREGRLHRVVRGAFGVATGGGAVWLPRATSVLRVDERTGEVRTIATGKLGLGGFQHELAVGHGAQWALRYDSRTRSTLVRIDLRSGRTTGTVSLPGIANALVITPRALWVATVLGATDKPASGYAVVRIDPRTLRRNLLVPID